VATIGEGTSTSLAKDLFEKRAGVDLLSVPYKGSAPAITDLVSGQVDLMFEGGASALPFVRQGKLRALGMTANKRDEVAAPNVPTMNEVLPGFEMTVWFGLVAPAGVPRPIVDQLSREVAVVMNSPKVQQLAETTGAKVDLSAPDALGQRIRVELQEFAKVMKSVGTID
jgi:tripartite-type tricarboxylate transporter receptor subunit TctC